jgi:hypothetical protein
MYPPPSPVWDIHLEGLLAVGVLSIVFLLVYIKKYVKEKEELWKLKYFTMPKKKNLSKNPLKETKILQDINYNSL